MMKITYYFLINKIIIISILLYELNFLNGQSFPRRTFDYEAKKIKYDAGIGWASLSIFDYNEYRKNNYSVIKRVDFSMQSGLSYVMSNEQNLFQLRSYIFLIFKNNYYLFYTPVLSNKSTINDNNFNNESIYFRNNTGTSGFGFKNNWVNIQIGKGTENWGAGNGLQLALNKNSKVYDYFLLGSDYNKVRVRYIHGFLEKTRDDINRYVTARGIEWTNKKSLIIGFSETIIYSGRERTIELGYLNPISSHLEVELNNRLKILGDRSANAVWQLHLDYLLIRKLRLSLNYLFDEFVFDPNIQTNKEHGRAFSIKMAFGPDPKESHVLSFYGSLVFIGSPTFRHGLGSNNFVTGEKPIGWQKGSDGQDISLGLNYLNNSNFIFSTSFGHFKYGEETILDRVFEKYSDYLKGPFPSGNINQTKYNETKIIYLLKNNISLSANFYVSKEINSYCFGVSYN
jgi:hypothetical protein